MDWPSGQRQGRQENRTEKVSQRMQVNPINSQMSSLSDRQRRCPVPRVFPSPSQPLPISISFVHAMSWLFESASALWDSVGEVLAPSVKTPLEDFKSHWRAIRNFYIDQNCNWQYHTTTDRNRRCGDLSHIFGARTLGVHDYNPIGGRKARESQNTEGKLSTLFGILHAKQDHADPV